MAKSKRTRKRNDHKSNAGEEPGPDISLLSRPSTTSVKGIRDVLKAYEEGTPEVHHLLSNECEIVYECRVCRSLYRSFLNFITHKRIYCQQQYTSGSPKVSHFFNDVLDEDETMVVHNESIRMTRQSVGEAGSHKEVEIAALASTSKPKQLPRKNLTEILGLLSQKANGNDGLQRLVNLDGYSALNAMAAGAGSDGTATGFKGRIPRQHLLHLESMESTDVAIKQTVTLGPDGKILPSDAGNIARSDNELSSGSNDLTILETKLVCSKCDSQFSNLKTYKHHMTFVHDPARSFYLCPCCKSKFSNSWSVHRHLKSVHNKTTEQMRRLRDQIQRVHKADPVRDKSRKPAPKQSSTNVDDLEQEKLYNERQSEMEVFEKEYNKCSGCNRSFDRLAAFNYHVRNCSRRNSALNTNLKSRKPSLPRRETLLSKLNESTASLPPPNKVTQVPAESSGDSSGSQPNAEPADLKPRKRQNSDKRPDLAVTKKIEIQLRRDYNKITAAPLNEDDEQENLPAGQEELSPTSISKIVASLVDYNKSLPAIPSSSSPTNGDDQDAESDQNSESVRDSSSSYNGETPLRGDSRETSISPNSMEEQPMRRKSCESRTNMRWDEISSNGTKSTSPSEDDDVRIIGERDGSDMSDCLYSPRKRTKRRSKVVVIPNRAPSVVEPVTMTKIKQNKPKLNSGKSILEDILTNDVADADFSLKSSENEKIPVLANENDVTSPTISREVKRASIMEWNGFEENFRGFEEPKAKRIRTHEELDMYEESLSSPSFTYNDFDDDDEDDDDLYLGEEEEESCHINTNPVNTLPHKEVVENVETISVVPAASADPPVQIAFNMRQVYQLLPLPDEVRFTPTPRVTVVPTKAAFTPGTTVAELDEVASNQELENDQDDSGINVFKSNAGGKVDVDEDILKVIFEEEDISQAASMLYKKGTIIMGNGTFSLGTSGGHEGTEADGSLSKTGADKRWSGEVKGRSSRSNSLDLLRPNQEKEPRPKSAIDPKSGPISPSQLRRRSSSNDGDFKIDSGAEVTPSSSMENLFPKTRPVRNRVKVQSDDFIYDLSDEVVSEGILSTPSSNTGKAQQGQGTNRTETQAEQGDKKKTTDTAGMNPLVMLVRTEDSALARPERIRGPSISELPAEEALNNNAAGFGVGNTIRKSVRAQVTKL